MLNLLGYKLLTHL